MGRKKQQKPTVPKGKQLTFYHKPLLIAFQNSLSLEKVSNKPTKLRELFSVLPGSPENSPERAVCVSSSSDDEVKVIEVSTSIKRSGKQQESNSSTEYSKHIQVRVSDTI